eukprot:TRINITY_DN111674_c0_g1_i1.p1 TRINITY_DN111674_c0_g1~~TRINITY_DN111674_c0_g1_i1.p1  ORF type:complete len:413 (+),score=56.50 TRINITY_DN111674_c0_g1_i1:71-1240(+)
MVAFCDPLLSRPASRPAGTRRGWAEADALDEIATRFGRSPGGSSSSSSRLGQAPPTPPRLTRDASASRVKLSPLPDAPAAPGISGGLEQRTNVPSPLPPFSSRTPSPARSSSSHLSAVWGLRRSAPSALPAPDDWLRSLPQQSGGLSRRDPWDRLRDVLAQSPGCDRQTGHNGEAASEAQLPRRSQPMLRVSRRRRHAADFGASLMGSAGQRRGRSCAGGAGETASTDERNAAADAEASRQLSRCTSVPPTGTAKSDEEAALRAKSRAVSMLQKLFFEEMASGGQDANGAAARALLRLTEASTSEPADEDGSAGVTSSGCAAVATATLQLETPEEGTPEAEAEEIRPAAHFWAHSVAEDLHDSVPMRPSPVLERRGRRPCPMARVRVHG